MRPSRVEIEVGNGEKLATDGTVRLPSSLSDYSLEHVFHICNDSSTAILGNDFIVPNHIHLFMHEGWMSYLGQNIPLFNRHGARQVRKVYLAKAVLIPPMREVEVPTYVKTPSKTSRPKMFEPNPNLFFDTHTLALRMLLNTRDAHPRVRLFNPSDEAITVKIHRCLGTVDDAFDIGIAPHGVPEEQSTSVRVHLPTPSVKPQSGAEVPPPADISLEEMYNTCKEDIPAHLKQLVSDTMTHLTDEEESKTVTLVLLAYQDVFAKDDTDIGKTDVITHDVDTGGCKPVCQPLR